MKPTARQKEICELIIKQAKAWRDTNDISSPSHYTYIMEELQATELCQDLQEILYQRLGELLYLLKIL